MTNSNKISRIPESTSLDKTYTQWHISFHTIVLLFLFSSIILQSCTTTTSPEQIVEDFITSCETSIEKGSGRELRNLIAENYRDSSGRTKKEIGNLVSGYLLRNRAIYSYSLVNLVKINEDDSISARVLTALAAKPITDISALPTLNSDIYWFDIKITSEDADWKLIDASWQQAMLDDFFQ